MESWRGEAVAAIWCGHGYLAVGGEGGRGRLDVAEGESVILCDALNVGGSGEDEVEKNSRL